MSDFVTSIVRDIVQKLLGVVFAYFAVNGFNVSHDTVTKVSNWAVLTVVALLLTTWTAIVRAFEERKGTSNFDVWCRAVGRILMLGIKTTPAYPTPPPPPQPAIEAPPVPVSE